MQSTDNSPQCCIEWLRWWFLPSRRLTAFSLSSPSLRGQLQGIWLDRHVRADWPVTFHSLLFLCSGSSLLFGSQFLASGPGLHICSTARIILPTHGFGLSGCREQPDAISISLRWWLHWRSIFPCGSRDGFLRLAHRPGWRIYNKTTHGIRFCVGGGIGIVIQGPVAITLGFEVQDAI